MKKSNERGDTDSFKTQKQSFKIAPKRRIKRKLKIRTLEKKQTYSKHISSAVARSHRLEDWALACTVNSNTSSLQPQLV